MKKQLGRKNAVCRDRSDTPDRFFHVGAEINEPELQFREGLRKYQVEGDLNGAISSNRTSLLRAPTARCTP